MSKAGGHLKWLQPTGEIVKTICGKQISVLTLNYDMTDSEIMSSWAKHFRNHYCSDSDLIALKPTAMSNSDYLKQIKFPHRFKKPGPSIRSGDFSEILVADYLETSKSYYVPRTRYDRKIIGDESSKGSDVMAFKNKNSNKPSNADELLIYEVKAVASENKPTNILQKAIDHSMKDEIRIAESLNAIRQRLHDRKDIKGVKIIDRFQNSVDLPYVRLYGAAAVLAESSYSSASLSTADTSKHPHTEKLSLLIISGKNLMQLIHALYERAANEA